MVYSTLFLSLLWCAMLTFAHRSKPHRTLPGKNKACQVGISFPDQDPLCLGIWGAVCLLAPAPCTPTEACTSISPTQRLLSVCSFIQSAGLCILHSGRSMRQPTIIHNNEQVTNTHCLLRSSTKGKKETLISKETDDLQQERNILKKFSV